MKTDEECQAVVEKLKGQDGAGLTDEEYLRGNYLLDIVRGEFPDKADRQRLMDYIAGERSSPFAQTSNPLNPAQFRKMVSIETNFGDDESTKSLLRHMVVAPRCWMPMGRDPNTGYYFRLSVEAYELRPSSEHEVPEYEVPETPHQLLPTNFLGVNFSINPTLSSAPTTPIKLPPAPPSPKKQSSGAVAGTSKPFPARPLNSQAHLSKQPLPPVTSQRKYAVIVPDVEPAQPFRPKVAAKSTELAQSPSDVDGFVFHQLGTLEYCNDFMQDIRSTTVEGLQDARWEPSDFVVVAALDPMAQISGIWIIYTPWYRTVTYEVYKQESVLAWGILPGHYSDSRICCAKIGESLRDFGFPSDASAAEVSDSILKPFLAGFSQAVVTPVEIVRVVKVSTPTGPQLRRITVAKKSEIIPGLVRRF